ncbi:TonB-dependent receptor [Solilutibacter silvestris]|uniref:TonB-siderophor: TonB-dependent siderophore receptor n=1 Tax=Solilutibacter silvestris TaxID=1645665 RepID=A0A2K1Q2Y6_9GAMM|nr:TonB-dependent siderophore receptor [Lysobacter silvestris]PNS09405.1 TonB-siderophor: TonB-dependent siderophore receptor [Lysobacter silvestris]
MHLSHPVPASLALAISCCLSIANAAETAAPADARQLDRVVVTGSRYVPRYTTGSTRSATRTDTPLVDVPQSVSVVTQELVKDQAMSGLTDALRYMPGVGVAQGEGNRDTAILRGNSTTGDFFVDGVRDDVQYIRDLYDVDRVEALKGANALVFGRGGSGGVINRIMKTADGSSGGELSLQYGSSDRKRATFDWQAPILRSAGNANGFRLNALYDDGGNFRDGYSQSKRAIHPTVHLDSGHGTTIDIGFEYFRDERVADRGVTSWQGKPIDVDPATFIGNAEQSPVRARANSFDIAIDHRFNDRVELRNHTRTADYDKSYQNVFGNGTRFDALDNPQVMLQAYRSFGTRRNLFNQTDLIAKLGDGDIRHTLLVGAEFGHQDNRSRTEQGRFGTLANVWVPLSAPRYNGIVTYPLTSADSDSGANVRALYVQDQIALGTRWIAIAGLRNDWFDVRMNDHLTGNTYAISNSLRSPRAGLVFKPSGNTSIYASYSVAWQPRSGDQLSSLTASTQALLPEKFVNREVGFKWDIAGKIALTAATYRLDRRNVAIPDPSDPTRSLLVNGQRSSGVELGLAGRITRHWQMLGGYAFQNGSYLATQSASVPQGNRLPQLPRHSASLWNRYDFTSRFGVGLGAIHRGSIYAAADNAVRIPAYTRWDAAVYFAATKSIDLQLNVENLFNTRYFVSANSNQNISPGSPRAAVLTARFAF